MSWEGAGAAPRKAVPVSIKRLDQPPRLPPATTAPTAAASASASGASFTAGTALAALRLLQFLPSLLIPGKALLAHDFFQVPISLFVECAHFVTHRLHLFAVALAAARLLEQVLTLLLALGKQGFDLCPLLVAKVEASQQLSLRFSSRRRALVFCDSSVIWLLAVSLLSAGRREE